ncbi:MAG: YdcF family protein [Shinella sp.]|nr:YdcF family protein [Shinella sp.]
MTRLATLCLVVLMVLSTTCTTALVFADPLLTVRTPLQGTADVIVVLGGDGPPRAQKAAQLWLEGAAPQILVTGNGDCGAIRDAMIEKGVDGSKIVTECRSRSTWQNAVFSAPLISRMDVGRALLVTSWFHSRRALDCFAWTMPDIEWMSAPAERELGYWALVFDAAGRQVLKEYPKILAYRLRALLQPPSALTAEAGMSLGRSP